MIETKKPQLSTLYFYLTSYCNLRCFHCWIAPEYLDKVHAPEEASFDLLKSIIDQAMPLGLKHIKITGGEPFLSVNFLDLIDYASSKDLQFSIETNGSLIDEEKVKFLKEKGAKFIAVSLDGPDETVHEKVRGVKGCFKKTIEGIKFLKKRGLNVQVIMSVYKDNIGHVEDTISMAESLGVNSFKINCISCVERGRSLMDKGAILSVSDYMTLDKKISGEIKSGHNIKIIFDIPPAFKPLKDIKNGMARCNIKNILGVLSDGRISICGIGENVDSLILGDISKEPLESIWKDNGILKRIREDLPHGLKGVCGDCIFKAYCMGKCRAEAYYRTNDLFSPFSFCEEALKSGLFPESRLLITSNKV